MITYRFENWRNLIAPKTLTDYPCKGCILRRGKCNPLCDSYDNYLDWWMQWSETIQKSDYPCKECIVDATCTLSCPEYEVWLRPLIQELPLTLFKNIMIGKEEDKRKFKITDTRWEYHPMIFDLPFYLPKGKMWPNDKNMSWKWDLVIS